ncbi:phytanoyl-CoA dioxygenase family protein [Aeoliella sp.]|uniref:phytanoyl-CoA dioxygenase family protein n=1 Tax=Aeoliella sp. TaxID=2795800 RepID=UPI003CCB9D51
MINSPDHRDEFLKRGYVVIERFLSSERLLELQQNIDRYIAEVVPKLPSSEAFYQHAGKPESLRQLQRMERDSFFDAYRSDRQWTELAETLLGEPVLAGLPEWFNKLPGGHPTPPHQDNHYFQLSPPQVVTMWLALDDIDEENGALRYVPGSHRMGRRPHQTTKVVGFSQGITNYGPDDHAEEQLVCMQAGDLVVHHGETIHRAEPNIASNRQRRAFAMVFRGVSCKEDCLGRKEYETDLARQHTGAGITMS